MQVYDVRCCFVLKDSVAPEGERQQGITANVELTKKTSSVNKSSELEQDGVPVIYEDQGGPYDLICRTRLVDDSGTFVEPGEDNPFKKPSGYRNNSDFPKRQQVELLSKRSQS